MGASSGALRLPLAPHSGVPPPSPAAAQGGRGHPPQRRRQRPLALPLVARARRRPRLDRQARRDLLQLGAGDDTPPSRTHSPLPILSGWWDGSSQWCPPHPTTTATTPLPLAPQRVFVEFFATGDAQKARHFDVQPFMDREQVVMPPLTPSPVRHHVVSPPPHPSSLSPPTAHPWHTLPHRLLTWQPPWTARRRPSPRRSRAS